MKKINLRDYYPYYTQDMIVEVPDEVALLLREYMLLEEAYRIRTYRYKAFYSLDRDEGIEREILQKPLNPAEIWEQRQMTELIYKGLSKLPVKQRQRIYAHFFLGMSKADIAKAEGTHKSRITRSIEAGLRLGQLLYQDLDIGSVDIYEFLKAKQPLLSLHGHIHESPDTENGSWMNQIGTTTYIQPGQTEFGDSSMVYAEIDLKSGAYARRIVNI